VHTYIHTFAYLTPAELTSVFNKTKSHLFPSWLAMDGGLGPHQKTWEGSTPLLQISRRSAAIATAAHPQRRHLHHHDQHPEAAAAAAAVAKPTRKGLRSNRCSFMRPLFRRCLAAAGCLVGAVDAHIPWLDQELQSPTSSVPQLPCERPVSKAPVRFPQTLLMGDAADGLTMFSGYVNVTQSDYLFYWFVEAEEGAPEDAPLIVWSNGGPGCSSMEGITTEHGPLVLFDIKEDTQSAPGKLSRNPYSWSKTAHVLYVDQPRYVGFSCGTGPFVASSVDAGQDLVNFLRGWRQLFPEHASRNVILAAESYGGHFVPAWSSSILDYNAAGVADPIRLVGLIIGNGIVNETIQDTTFPEFARRHGLIPENINVNSSWGAREIMKNYLGYEPNYYDYRLVEQGCCGCSSYNYKPWSDWMMRKDVQLALNVCGNSGAKAFAGCASGCVDLPSFDEDDTFSYSGALGRALDLGIHVTFYYGMQDTACNYVGGFQMASSLEWRDAEQFRHAELRPLKLGEVVMGSIKSVSGLTWIQVDGAGHMVPINQPAAAFYAISTLTQKNLFDRATYSTLDTMSAWSPIPGLEKLLSSSTAERGGGGGGGGGRPEQQQQQQEKQKQQYAGVQGAQKSAPNGAPVTAQPGGNTFGGLGAFGFARSYGLWTVVTCCLVGMIAAAVSLQRIRPRRGRSVQAGDREDSSLFEFLFRTTPEDTL